MSAKLVAHSPSNVFQALFLRTQTPAPSLSYGTWTLSYRMNATSYHKHVPNYWLVICTMTAVHMNIYWCFIMFSLMLSQDFWYPDWKFSYLESRWVEFHAVSGFDVNEIMSKQHLQQQQHQKTCPMDGSIILPTQRLHYFFGVWNHSTKPHTFASFDHFMGSQLVAASTSEWSSKHGLGLTWTRSWAWYDWFPGGWPNFCAWFSYV